MVFEKNSIRKSNQNTIRKWNIITKIWDKGKVLLRLSLMFNYKFLEIN